MKYRLQLAWEGEERRRKKKDYQRMTETEIEYTKIKVSRESLIPFYSERQSKTRPKRSLATQSSTEKANCERYVTLGSWMCLI